MNNQTFFDFSNKSLDLTYSIIDILLTVIFFALFFGVLYKALLFSIRTISSILNALFGNIRLKKDDYDSYEDNLNFNQKAIRKACFAEDDVPGKKSNNKKLMLKEGTNKTIDDILNNRDN